jgi:hypothetical protein
MEKCFVKERWERRQREEKDKPGETTEIETEMELEERKRLEEVTEKLEAKNRMIFDEETKIFDYANHRPPMLNSTPGLSSQKQ